MTTTSNKPTCDHHCGNESGLRIENIRGFVYLVCPDCYGKDLNRAEDMRTEMIGPRCHDCGGYAKNTPWAGREYDVCECAPEDDRE